MISAKIIKDSADVRGNRITTFVLTFPRYILAEFNTHRMFSRNSASSRAIPFNKMLEMVKTNPFIPIKWMKEHTGMQGTEYFEHPHEWDKCKQKWLDARDLAITMAEHLTEYGVTKQLCNRLLEPFMWHTVLVTATEFKNFFALRANEAADIHLQDLANKMLIEYNKSIPEKLKEGQWHIPFGDTFDEDRLWECIKRDVKEATMNESVEESSKEIRVFTKIEISTARCARISYNSFEGKDDYNADLKLHDRLLESGHWSAFEHCAKVMNESEYEGSHGNAKYAFENQMAYENGWCGNFRGFIQYRKMFNNENRTDNRVKMPCIICSKYDCKHLNV